MRSNIFSRLFNHSFSWSGDFFLIILNVVEERKGIKSISKSFQEQF